MQPPSTKYLLHLNKFLKEPNVTTKKAKVGSLIKEAYAPAAFGKRQLTRMNFKGDEVSNCFI